MKKLFLKIIIIALIIPSFVTAVRAVSIDELKQQIQQKQTEIQQLEKEIAAYKEEIKNKKAEANTLSKQISYMQTQIVRLEAEIKLTQTEISATNLKVEELTAEINAKISEINKQKSNLGQTIRAIYEFDQATPLELVLANETFSSFLNQVQFIENLQAGLQTKLNYIKDLKNQLEDKKTEAQNQKEELEQLRNELSGKTLVLNNQKEESQDLLIRTRNQEKKYQQMLSDLQKQREAIQKEIYALEDKLRLTIDPNSIPAYRSGLLAWPLKGIITQKYGPTSETGFINEAYKFHNGIDIAADIGDPIKSAADGVVKAKGDNGKYAYGKWLTIDHQNGLITLYAHLSAYAVSVGQTVKSGQIIGYAGSTGFSTGPHLHFTVYAAATFITEQKWFGLLPLGGHINPINYL